MFRLRALYAAFIAAVMLIFTALYTRGAIPYAYINIVPALIAPAACIFPPALVYAAIAVSWLIVYPALLLVPGIGPAGASYPAALFSIFAAGYLWYAGTVKREEARQREAFAKADGQRLMMSEELGRAVRFENGIKSKEAEIVNLYEITRKMSEHLKFEDMFRAFSVFLKENFSFRKCDLFILKRSEDKLAVERSYSVWLNEPAEGVVVQAGLKGERLIGLFKGGPRDVWLTKADNARALKALGIEDGAVETFVALPLLSEHKIVGILAIENLPKDDLERFVILAMQFALEIKKVLLYELVERLAVTDSLTGLYGRRYFYERIEEELQRAKRYKFKLAFMMVDIDDFKKCNDTYGHMVGDVVLKEVTRVIKEGVREIDIVGRYGGEEFAIALPETGSESALQVAERLRSKVAEAVFKAYDEKLKFTISIGVAAYPEDASEINDIIDRADEALYEAKRSGKNVVREYKR